MFLFSGVIDGLMCGYWSFFDPWGTNLYPVRFSQSFKNHRIVVQTVVCI